jgi:glycine oxidase
MNQKPSALIIGGGMIGCSIAYELAKSGFICTLLDKGSLLSEASAAAAGMLGGHVETHQPGPFFELSKASQRLFPDWAAELQLTSGISPQYVDKGILRVAFDDEDRNELLSRLEWMGGGAEWLGSKEILLLEPAVNDKQLGGLFFPQDHQVHVRHLGQALHASLHKLDVTIKEWLPVSHILESGGRAVGVHTPEGDYYADHVILTTGSWSSSLLNRFEIDLKISPVKGQCMSVRPAKPTLSSTLFTKGCYIVPKLDGTMIIGATQEQIGFDKRITIAAITELTEKASRLIPELKQAEFIESWTGLRPGTPDELPYIGASKKLPGLVLATGHFRNGILLSPITGKLINSLLTNQALLVDIEAFSPERVLVKSAAI